MVSSVMRISVHLLATAHIPQRVICVHGILRLQLEAKTRKLKKVWHKLQSAQAEIRDLTDEFQTEREDMLDTIRELNKQLKLKQLILDNFVPAHELEKVRSVLSLSMVVGKLSLITCLVFDDV